MTIADKLLNLRKKHNLSQEELAEKLNVSRQSISKWESATSIPDITKIVALAKFFSVTTDYLLYDDLQSPEYTKEEAIGQLVSIEEANRFLDASKKRAGQIAFGVVLCILSPVLLLFLSTLSEQQIFGFWGYPALADIIGLLWFFVCAATSVAIFIASDNAVKPFAYLKTGGFELSFGVFDIVKEQHSAFMPHRTKSVIISVSLFIVGTLPFMITSFIWETELVSVTMLLLLFAAVAVGVHRLIICEIQHETYEILLSEGNYTPEKLNATHKHKRIGEIYWPIIMAIYLGWSLLSNDWKITWIVWPIAALLFVAVSAVFSKE